MKKISASLLSVLISFSAIAQITVTANSNSVGMYDVYELNIAHSQSPYANVWEDVSVTCVFTNGTTTDTLYGFYYNTDTWKVRFAPNLTGTWNYSFTLQGNSTFTATGSFTGISSTNKGFLRKHPGNNFRLVYPDGTLFNGIGIQDCMLDGDTSGSPIDTWGFDGDFRPIGQEAGSDTTMQAYMTAFGKNGAGFNLYRWTIDNCSFNIYQHIGASGNIYKLQEGLFGDTLVEALKQNGFRIYLTMFGFNPPFPNITGSTPAEEAALKRYIKYVVARYGAYTDMWELMNEANVTTHWIGVATTYLRSIDTYNRLIGTSWEQPANTNIDIDAPHWYEKESELQSDTRTIQKIDAEKPNNKPIIFGEQGNSVQNWDSLSALRMRIRSWTAFFDEGIFIFWNSSWAKDYFSGAANIYLGPIERSYIRAMQNFTAFADSGVRIFTITPANANEVRAYGLKSDSITLGYFHHYTTHYAPVTTSFNITLANSSTVYWLNPANDSVLQTYNLTSGNQTLTSPAFNVDMALRITRQSINTGISSPAIEQTDFQIYPNPATSQINIDWQNSSLQIKNIEVLNVVGEKFFSQNFFNSKLVSIDVSQWAKGVYLLVVRSEEQSITKKIIIQNP